MSDIKKFYSLMQSKQLRLSNQFQVTLALTGVDGLDDIIKFYAAGAKLPGTTVNPVEVSYQGMKFQIPGNIEIDGSIDFEIKLDNDMEIYDKIMQWQKQFADIAKGGGGNKVIPNSKIILDLLDGNLKDIVKTYELHGAWPTSVGEIEFTHEGADLSTCAVGLVFQWFDEVGGNGIG
jgi:hypothetical protein